jgi:hypothetical protein
MLACGQHLKADEPGRRGFMHDYARHLRHA